MRKSFLITEFADDVFRLDVEYKEDGDRYHFSLRNHAGQVVRSGQGVRSFTGEKDGTDYISIEGRRILYNPAADCVLFAETDSDAQRATSPYRAPNGSIYYGLDQAKIKNWYIVIEDSPEEVFERYRLRNKVTQEDAANIKNLSDECWINALKEFRKLR